VGQLGPNPLDSAHPSGPARILLCVEQLEPHPAETGKSVAWHSSIHQCARNPTHWVELAPALQASQITAPPVSHSGHH
jgi:hypothetical protein